MVQLLEPPPEIVQSGHTYPAVSGAPHGSFRGANSPQKIQIHPLTQGRLYGSVDKLSVSS